MTELAEQIQSLYSEGMSYRKIQDELGCSKGTISYYLGQGQKEKTAQRQRDRRGEIKILLQEYKQNSICADCKEDYPYWILQFDHLSDKEFGLSGVWAVTTDLDRIKKEIEKCEVVCANCHADRTHLRAFKNGSNSPDISEFY